MLTIHNSMSGKKDTFTPIMPGKINMYVCGMTVYDYCHLGHARVLITFDMVSRYLRTLGYDVKYVCNITDIDDKIIHRAKEKNISVNELTAFFIDAMHEDCRQLNVLPPDLEPRATEHIPDIIALIEALITNKKAYIARNGDVYYDVSEFPQYGRLSKQDLAKLRAGVRIDVSEAKTDPLDFVLWKMAKPDEPSWPSPWGAGRPGWHIECSAMSMDCLGEHFDIHGGGPDLKFPHHENEIAQSEGKTGKTFVNMWMHVGALTINEEKMSKSLGNIRSIRDILQDYPAEVVRYFLLSSHYRSPLNYSLDNLDNAALGLRRFYIAFRDLPEIGYDQSLLTTNQYAKDFHQAMQDDFNTPVAMAVLFDMTHAINKIRETDPTQAAQLVALIKHLAIPLGILQSASEDFLQADLKQEDISKIEALIAQREQARRDRNWQKADDIRDQLAAMSIELEDAVGGTQWRKATTQRR